MNRSRMNRILTALAWTIVALAATLPAIPAAAEQSGAATGDFNAMWHDGRAELNGYVLKVSRYGEERDGHAVMVYVTEPFSESKRVKVNDHRRNPGDVVDVLKLNLVRDFQTGIYDYNTMTSVFVRTADLQPLKVTFSSAEWCGHVFTEMVYRDRIEGFYSSYFEGESGAISIDRPQGAISEDNLFILLRGLRGDFLARGASKDIQMLPSAYFARLGHGAIEYRKATITRAAKDETITVPAGTFQVSRYEINIADGREGAFWIESAYPHRIVRWALLPDVLGELTGSARLKYWTLHGNGDESYLDDIGLGGEEKR